MRVVAPISAWAIRGHAIVGELVRRHLATGASLRELVEADARLGPDAAELVAPGVGVQQRSSPGGAGPAAFDAQLTAYRQLLADERRRLDDR